VLVPTRPVNNGKGPGSDITVDDGGSIILPINKGKKTEDTFLKEGTLPGSTFIDNVKFKSVLPIIKRRLKAGETNTWHHIASHCKGVSEETTTGVYRLYITPPMPTTL
jgi:adenosylhomocysteinase